MTTDPRLTILAQIEGAILALRDLGLTRVVPTHYAGDPAKAAFRRAYSPSRAEWAGRSPCPTRIAEGTASAPGVVRPVVPANPGSSGMRQSIQSTDSCPASAIGTMRSSWPWTSRTGQPMADGNEGDPSSRTHVARKPKCTSTGIAAMAGQENQAECRDLRRGSRSEMACRRHPIHLTQADDQQLVR